MCGFGHSSNSTEWNSRLSSVNRCGSKSSRVRRIRSLSSRARSSCAGVRYGAESAVAAPSTIERVCMVCRYSVSLMSATWAPTLRSKVTSPSASSRRIASRTGTTDTSSSFAIWPSTSRYPGT